MTGRVKLEWTSRAGHLLSRAAVVGGIFLLSACSMVPDAVNPIEWYKGASDMITGTDRADVAEHQTAKGAYPDVNTVPQRSPDSRKDLPKGLIADRSNAKYAEPVARQVSPTKPLVRKTPAPAAADTQVASVSPQAVVPPAPAVQASELRSSASTANQQQTARGELGPNAPPNSVNMEPPAPADVPAVVPMPGERRVKPLQRQYEKRLAESAQASIYPGMVDMASRVSAGDAYSDDAPIHLVPPSAGRHGGGLQGGGKGFAAPPPPPAASFQVASLDFSGTSAKLTSADRSSIAEVARLYKQTGGVVRVIGHAPQPAFSGFDPVSQMMGSLEASNDRAVAVARELSRRGVPSTKIMIAADTSVAMNDSGGARVFIDVM